ncbi:MAG: glycosyltransferase family 2 protein [Acidobacteriota bacterium]
MPASKVAVIIPARDEEQAIGKLIAEIPHEAVQQIIVADNGSLDRTAEVAAGSGAEVVAEPRKGYGQACLAGMRCLAPDVSVVVFMDGDYSDLPAEIPLLLEALHRERADLVIGSRVLGQAEKGSLTPQQRFGNWLSTELIRLAYGHRYTDLGPFRAIRAQALNRLQMQDPNFGWTVEMQVKALRLGMKVIEVPVSYRRRIGKSKVSGTIAGSIQAGVKILWTIGRLSLKSDAAH